MKKKTKIAILLIIVFSVAGYFVIPYIIFHVSKWHLCRTSFKKDLSAVPREIPTPEIDRSYLATLKKHAFPNFVLYLPKGYKFYRESKGGSISFKEYKGTEVTTYLIVSGEPISIYDNMGEYTKKKLESIGIKNDYDYFIKIFSTTKKTVRNTVDITLLVLKQYMYKLSKQEEILTFPVKDKRIIVVYGMYKSNHMYECFIFNKQGKSILTFTLVTEDDNFDLEKLAAIISKMQTAA